MPETEPRICPLFMAAMKVAQKPANSGAVQCLEDKCGWWLKYNKGGGACAIVSIAEDMPEKAY